MFPRVHSRLVLNEKAFGGGPSVNAITWGSMPDREAVRPVCAALAINEAPDSVTEKSSANGKRRGRWVPRRHRMGLSEIP